MSFSPQADFYAASAQVIPLLLLALVFEARAVTRIGSALREPPSELMAVLDEDPQILFGTIYPDDDVDPVADLRAFFTRKHAPLRRAAAALLLAAAVFAVVAEGVALSALVLDEPPAALAAIVLVGCCLSLIALLAGIAETIVREVGWPWTRKPS